MNKKFCVACGFNIDSNDYKNVCLMCGAMSNLTDEQLDKYSVTVCGDDVCYLDYQGMPNFDGDCSHEEEFRSLIPAY